MNKNLLIESLKSQGFSLNILKAFNKVPREKFISKDLEGYAYEDIALHLEEGATISQPYTIAFMLDLLDLNGKSRNMKILELGSGCGYALALLYEMTKGDLYGIEVLKELAIKSRKILAELGYDKIKVINENGYLGLGEKAPFDIILISASCEEMPKHLFKQLKDKGIMVVPVRNSIFKIKKVGRKFEIKEFEGFVFVPLIKN